MAQANSQDFLVGQRSNWVRLRTLVILRWFAVAGQLGAVLVGVYFFELVLEVGLIAMTIGVSVLANIFSVFLYPANKRLSEREATFMISFDLVQLGVLLYLAGGLNNPFALLILAPVTISATILRTRSTIALGVLALIIISLLSWQSIPILTETGFPLILPSLFVFGFWCALVVGVIFLGIYAHRVTQEMISMGEALVATQMALSREQKLTDLGGVVAAAAHELGTPLATIKLVSSELLDELEDSDLIEDARLIRDQTDRCRDILRSMGRAGKDDKHLQTAPFETVIREAAEPHIGRDKDVLFEVEDQDGGRHPYIYRRPEIIHGVRNLIQNAVDFSRTAVLVEISWTDEKFLLRISDDGAGFPPSIIGRIGDPFMRRRKQSQTQSQRPGYEGMGLGLFIAKTLLERSGATLAFANGGARAISGHSGGAIVNVSWDRDSIVAPDELLGTGLGSNEQFT